MDFNSFLDALKWLLLPAIGAFFFLYWKNNKDQRDYITEKNDELRATIETHNAADAEIHRNVMAEVNALRAQVTGFQIEVAKYYVTTQVMNAALEALEQGIRRDVTEIKADVKQLLGLLIPGAHHDSRRG